MGMMISRRRSVEAAEPEEKQELTKAELVEKAKAMGIEVPAKATKADIQKLIDEA